MPWLASKGFGIHRFCNSAGVSLVQVVVMLGVTSVLSLSVASIATMQNKGQYEMSLKSSVVAMRQNFTGVMANQSAWDLTRSKNSGMRCTSPQQANCNAQGGHAPRAVNLYNSAGQLIIDSMNPRAGFTSFGEPCNDFNPNGNNACPLRAVLTWRAACTTQTCTATQFSADELVSIEFIYAPGEGRQVPFNPQNFNLVEQSRLRITDNSSPVLGCANSGKVFIGVNKIYRGHSADGQGCVSYAAFLGATGATGPRGSTGATGPRGYTGASGADAVCPTCPVCPG